MRAVHSVRKGCRAVKSAGVPAGVPTPCYFPLLGPRVFESDWGPPL